MIKYERISFTNDMLEGMYYNAMKVNKRNTHIKSIILLAKKKMKLVMF